MTDKKKISDLAASAHAYRWVVLGGVWLVYFCFGLTIVTLAPLVNVVGLDLGLSHSRMGTVMGAWQLVFIASAVPCGVLLDRIGPRRALVIALLVIAASGALRAAAGGHLSLFLAVAVFGLGGPLVSVGAPKLIGLWFEGQERRFAMGLYMTGPAMGSMASLALTNSLMMPLLGGNWRAVMLAYAAIVLAAGLVWLAITAHPASRAIESRLAAAPREPQLKAFAEILQIPAVRIVLAMSIGIFFINHGLNNWLPEILRSHGMGVNAAGFWAALPTAVGIVAAPTIPRLATPARRMGILAALFLLAAGATLLLLSANGTLLAAALVMQGVARGGMMTLAMLILLDVPEVGTRRTGLAGGLFFSAAEIGGSLGPMSIGVLAQWSGGFATSLAMLTGITVVLMALLVALRR
ncbi:MAG: MFS transporter [Alphaproteobacteria bacterium]|nr:MFS transporter [Alphaproteobacteria bacterium]